MKAFLISLLLGGGAYIAIHGNTWFPNVLPYYPWAWPGLGVVLFLYAVIQLLRRNRYGGNRPILRILGLSWSLHFAMRHYFIAGATGKGKTTSGLNMLNIQFLKNVSDFGGLFLDDKGVLVENFLPMAERYGRAKDVVFFNARDPKCKHRFNLLGDEKTPAEAYAKLLCDTAQALSGAADKKDPHFDAQAEIYIAQLISAIRYTGGVPTVRKLLSLLNSPMELNQMVAILELSENELARDVQSALHERFLSESARDSKETAGVKSTIVNKLQPYVCEPFLEMFNSEATTFTFEQFDEGALVFLAVPADYSTQKRFVNTFLKLLFYLHGLRRFDDIKNIRSKNILILEMDEAQQMLTAGSGGNGDHEMAAVLREARMTLVMATQSLNSFLAKLGSEHEVKTLLASLGTKIFFSPADPEVDAELISKVVGQHLIQKRTHQDQLGGAASSSYTDEWKPILEAGEIKTLPDHHAIVTHPNGKFARGFIQPYDKEGNPFTPASA